MHSPLHCIELDYQKKASSKWRDNLTNKMYMDRYAVCIVKLYCTLLGHTLGLSKGKYKLQVVVRS
jgi:hypothetical protein